MRNKMNNKIDELIDLIKEAEENKAYFSEKLKAISAEIKEISATESALRNELAELMKSSDVSHVRTEKYSVTRMMIKKTKVIDERAIPLKYVRTKLEVNKALILKDLKAGKEIEGVELEDSDSGVRIKEITASAEE